MEKTRLSGTSNINKRLEFLYALFHNAKENAIHITEKRHKNINYALLIFAGLFGLGTKLNNFFSQAVISSIIFFVMLLFLLGDRKLHKTCYAWGRTADIFYEKICEIINTPTIDVEFYHYDHEAEKMAGRSLYTQSLVYYFLILGGFLSFFIFRFVVI